MNLKKVFLENEIWNLKGTVNACKNIISEMRKKMRVKSKLLAEKEEELKLITGETNEKTKAK